VSLPANIGIATGLISGLLVVDEDPRNGGVESLERLEADYSPLPTTIESRTGGHGTHRLFKHPGPEIHVQNRTHVAGYGGIDIKGDGGYIIAPPSNHLSGGLYEWRIAPGTLALAPAPAFIISLATGGSPSERASYQRTPWDGTLPTTVEALLADDPLLDDRIFQRSATGLSDQSPSGVDLSIASLLANSCIPGNDIEATIRWSRVQAQLPDKKRSYLEATVGKALGSVRNQSTELPEHANPAKVLPDTETQLESPQLTRIEQLLAYLDRKRDKQASSEEVRRDLSISPTHLSHLLKTEEDTENRIRRIHRGKRVFIKLRTGSGIEILSLTAPPRPPKWEAAYLPRPFGPFIGPTYGGLPGNSFVLVAGAGDAGKTNLLINTAIWNAVKGKRVLFVDHEGNTDSFRVQVARRYKLQNGLTEPIHPDSALAFLKTESWYRNLILGNVPGVADLDEFLEELGAIRPDVIVYDYLNQSLITVDSDQSQRSLPATIVQTIAQKIVDKGTPFITAVQLNRGEKGKPYVLPTWEQRATVSLELDKAVPSDRGWETNCFIHKNKLGYDKKMTRKLVISVRGDTHGISDVRAADETPSGASAPKQLEAPEETRVDANGEGSTDLNS
jgi:Mrp family chromosome partitioning ATPase